MNITCYMQYIVYGVPQSAGFGSPKPPSIDPDCSCFLTGRCQVLGFVGTKYIFRGASFFYYMLKTNFSGHNTVWWGQKLFGGHCL